MADVSPVLEHPLSEEERLGRRAQIDALEAHMNALGDGDQLAVDPMTSHIFASGVYARRMDIPAGAVVVGGLHRTEHLAILLKGRVRITTEEGATELEAPQVMVAPPGTKRVAYAITDAAWLSIHAVGAERDVKAIERQFIAPNHDALAMPDATKELA